MRRVRDWMERLSLLGLGGWAYWAVFGGSYDMLMNPGYQWLSAIAAGVLLFMGIAAVRIGHRSENRGASILFPLLLVIVLAATPAFQSDDEDDDDVDNQIAREELDGREYLRINLAEIFIGLDDERLPADGRVVVRGMVKFQPTLTEEGSFALARTSVWCCLADAVGFAVRVPYDRSDPLEDGQWVRVFGRIERLTPPATPLAFQMQPAFFTSVHDGYRIRPDRIEKIDPPSIPFIFQIRTEEPYAY